jgi:hypothetical protein
MHIKHHQMFTIYLNALPFVCVIGTLAYATQLAFELEAEHQATAHIL